MLYYTEKFDDHWVWIENECHYFYTCNQTWLYLLIQLKIETGLLKNFKEIKRKLI